MNKKNTSYKLAKKYIRKNAMPSSLLKKFQEHELEHELESVYLRSAELFEDNKAANKALHMHLGQILPCIAFYEELIKQEGSREKALVIYEKWSLCGMYTMAESIQKVLKLPCLYKLVPKIFKIMVNMLFGTKAGFKCRKIHNFDGWATDMIACPYVSICKKYGYPELAQFFCKSDDISYENMHPKLVWARTKTLGRGDECCDFRLYIDKQKNSKKF